MGDRERRREYIDAAYKILDEEGLESISIRKVADAVGSSSAALYKHFDNLDELISYASIRFLNGYATDTQMMSKVDLDPLQLNIQLWECFVYYAFKNVPIFERMFFSETTQTMDQTMLEYYQLFPEELKNMSTYMVMVMENGDLFDRDYRMLIRGVDAGLIEFESASYLRDVDTYLFHGMLASFRTSYKDKEVQRHATRRFMELMVGNYNSQLLPGHQIMQVSPILDPSRKPNEPSASPRGPA